MTIIRRGNARKWHGSFVGKIFFLFFAQTSIRNCPTFRDTLLYLAFVRKLANFTSRKSHRDALCQRDRQEESVLLFFFFFPHCERRDATFTLVLSSRDTSYRALCTQTTPGIFSFFFFQFPRALFAERFFRRWTNEWISGQHRFVCISRDFAGSLVASARQETVSLLLFKSESLNLFLYDRSRFCTCRGSLESLDATPIHFCFFSESFLARFVPWLDGAANRESLSVVYQPLLIPLISLMHRFFFVFSAGKRVGRLGEGRTLAADSAAPSIDPKYAR